MVDEPFRGTRKDMRRAIWRLSVLEYVMLGLAALAALLGGAMAAWLLQSATGIPFRWTWTIASILLFALPGLAVWGREARRDGTLQSAGGMGSESRSGEQDGG